MVTSPPYNIGKDYDIYDDKISRYEYLKWTRAYLLGIERLLTGSLFLNVGSKPTDPLIPFQVLAVATEIFKLQNVIYWVKSVSVDDGAVRGHNKPVGGSRFLNDCVEHIFHLSKDGYAPLDRLSIGVEYADKSNLDRDGRGKNGDLRCRGNAWVVPYETVTAGKPHPAAFPVKIAEMCLRLGKATRVLDPFAGSGTVGVAAKALGIPFEGIELSADYTKDANDRIARAA